MGYSNEQKRAVVEKARRLLQELDRADARTEAEVNAAASDALTVASEDAPAPWPRAWGQEPRNEYGVPVMSGERMRRWKAEGEEINRRQEQARLERQQETRDAHEQRVRSSADWNSWVEQRINEVSETKLFNEAQQDVLARLLGRMRGELEKLKAEIGELRAELTVQRAAADKANERDGPVIDLVPSPVMRRNGSR